MKRKTIIWMFGLLCPFLRVMGENVEKDSLRSQKERPAYLMPAIGGGLVVAGSLLDFDHGGSTLGMNLKPSFDYKADEVLRFVPAMALVGMKSLGVESRTERWSELMVRSAGATAIMGLSVESVKRLAGRVRPDGSDERSFPSGHSATAFLTASLFAKEYGHLSPWYSVGAYGVATSTAMLRRMGDHHWMSDVMVGAGIGILSVEIGYALADAFFATHPHKAYRRDEGRKGASSAGVYMHYVLPHALSGEMGNLHIHSNFGYSAGLEANHFFTDHIGIAGRMGITSSQMEIDGETIACPLDHVTLGIGPTVSWPLCPRLTMGAHMLGGYGFYPQTEWATMKIKGSQGWGYEGGISLAYITHQNVSLALSADYRAWSNPTQSIENKGFSIGLSAGWGW